MSLFGIFNIEETTYEITYFWRIGINRAGVVKQALEQNYQVTAFVRKPENFEIKHNNLKIAPGDITNYEIVERTVKG